MAKKDNDPAGEGPRPPDRKLSALDRAVLAAIGDGRTVGRDDDPARDSYPEVWEWLTKTADNAGKFIMQPAVISIQLGPEGVLVSMTHRDLKVMVGVCCLHLDDAIPALQRALSGENPPVRSWGKDEPVLRKRRQK